MNLAWDIAISLPTSFASIALPGKGAKMLIIDDTDENDYIGDDDDKDVEDYYDMDDDDGKHDDDTEDNDVDR